MGVGPAADDALVPPGQPHGRMAGADAEGQHGPRQVVPVDDEAGAAQPGGDEGDQQGRDGRRILHEDHVRLAHHGQEHPD